MSRYPYTVCADALRIVANEAGEAEISRAQAAHIKAFVARALNVDERKVAVMIADYAIQTRLCYDTDTTVLESQQQD